MEDGQSDKERDALIATMFRMDPDRLRQLRRVMSGVTRCPECDAVNPAGEKRCVKCGARLYAIEEANERFPWQDEEDEPGEEPPYKRA